MIAEIERPVGPSRLSLLGLVPSLLRSDPVEVAVKLREKYGRVVRVPPVYPGIEKPIYLVTHPDDVQAILESQPGKFRELRVASAREFGRVVERLQGMSTSDRKEWLRQLSPEFNERMVSQHVPEIAAETLTTLTEYNVADRTGSTTDFERRSATTSVRRRLEETVGNDRNPARVRTTSPGTVRVLPLMQRLSLRLLGVTLLGPDVRAHEARVIRAVMTLRRQFKRRNLNPLPKLVAEYWPGGTTLPAAVPGPLMDVLPGEGEARIDDAVETLTEVADRVVQARQRTPRVYDDALATWLTRPDPVTGDTTEGEAMRRVFVSLLLAGFATLGAALTWALYLAAAHPWVQDRIFEEAREIPMFASVDACRDGETVSRPEGEQLLEQLQFTRQFWHETLRLFPTLPVFGRTVRERMSLRGHEIPAKTPVLVSPYVTHRDPAFWDDPEEFDPSRFVREERGGRPEYAYYPFGGGPHACLGKTLATTEAVTALATIFRTHRVSLTAGRSGSLNRSILSARTEPSDTLRNVGVDSAINLHPDRPLFARFVPRCPVEPGTASE